METKFTKGKWILPHFVTKKEENDCDCRFVLNELYCGAIATVHYDNGKKIQDGGNDDPPLEEAKANAKLICAAPDLFKELNHLVRLLEPLEKEGFLGVPGLATLNGARMALKKATE